jgi:hypothetical protein
MGLMHQKEPYAYFISYFDHLFIHLSQLGNEAIR